MDKLNDFKETDLMFRTVEEFLLKFNISVVPWLSVDFKNNMDGLTPNAPWKLVNKEVYLKSPRNFVVIPKFNLMGEEIEFGLPFGCLYV